MKLTIHVKPNSKKVFLRREEDGSITVAVREPALEGKANAAVIAALSEELGVPKKKIRILSGEKGKKKTIEIDP
ncbi:DUF167 domain-containing protein [Leptospira yasudae]|uniref:UPF0235 protein EHQ83_01375 n=1 Tax=Leptospira yasudae TaxID=2202201 RepID=A0A5F2BJ60_9LEPT|nr:DUF167 domain-containing protein [Leptospira yasudae]MBW0434212.1 DUF167 domain-containing protein [Leptospira yasudae]RHX91276.1 DUF167 domain-containing protein [Leptospira yasudae]TGK24604.1 DUF167 domain-containing protein [Leptospira yasudae]TGL80311.1 DUF167 domain-containing protein [Leptospira yasudae]TGL81914.1 DUF167 domain-containing protein [Leptospira yasudae]